MTASEKLNRKGFVLRLKKSKSAKDFQIMRELCNYAGRRLTEVNKKFERIFPEYEKFECASFHYDFNKIFTVPTSDRSAFGQKFGNVKVRVVHGGYEMRGKYRYNVLFVKTY